MLESAYEFPPQNNLLDFDQTFENLCRLIWENWIFHSVSLAYVSTILVVFKVYDFLCSDFNSSFVRFIPK